MVKNKHKEEIITNNDIEVANKQFSIEYTILSYIVATKEYRLINRLQSDYFQVCKEQFNFLQTYFENSKTVPSREIWLGETGNKIFDIDEDININRVLNELLSLVYFRKIAKIIDESDKIIDIVERKNFLYNAFKDEYIYNDIHAIDLLKDNVNFEEIDEIVGGYIPTSFLCLNEAFFGIKNNGNELITVVGRTGQGKTWFLLKLFMDLYDYYKDSGLQRNIGFISPELTAGELILRFESLENKNIDITKGFKGLSKDIKNQIQAQRKQKVANAKNIKSTMYVSDLFDFNNKITIDKIEDYIIQYKLGALIIDGISYIDDKKVSKNDNLTTKLTIVANSLFQLSKRLEIPIIISVQANREAVKNKKAGLRVPSLIDIRDSDGIAFNSTIVISVGFDENSVENLFVLNVIKNRRGFKFKDEVEVFWNLQDNSIKDFKRAEEKLISNSEFDKDNSIKYNVKDFVEAQDNYLNNVEMPF